MTGTESRYFLFRSSAGECITQKQRIIFHVWNIACFCISAIILCGITLMFAFGHYSYSIFFAYFTHPLIFLLNLVPILLLQALLYAIFNRAWLAFTVNALFFELCSLGNYFKLIFRDDPFMFADISAIHTAFGVSSGYNIAIDKRIALSLVLIVGTAVLLCFFARGKASGKARIALVLIATISVYPLWHLVYSSKYVYGKAEATENINPWIGTQVYISKGFIYPFAHSIANASDTPPEGYDEDTALSCLSEYSDSDIPKDRKVNIISVQLEAYYDFTKLGLEGISDDVYKLWHQLEAESYTGELVTNVFGGGTINTERCFLTGFPTLRNFRADATSYAWYLRSQGYKTCGSHPCYRAFYNRNSVNSHLGFEDYYYLENHYEELTGGGVAGDDILFPEILKLYRQDIASGKPVFSFNVTYQGHGPYPVDILKYDECFWDGTGYSETAKCGLNNYFGSIENTNENIWSMINQLREDESPVVVVFYGDHMPWMGDNNCIYDELGLDFDLSAEKGFMDYYSTNYLIWANDSAKLLLGNDFAGEGPRISPNYLMNVLFSQLGWEGNSYMKLTNSVMEAVPVINSNGFYIENGRFGKVLSADGARAEEKLSFVSYYLQNNLIYQGDTQ